MARHREKSVRDGAIHRFREGRWDELKPWQFHPLATVFTAYYAVKQFMKDRGDQIASSLAYTTALSLVPLLSVFVSALALAGSFDDKSPTLRAYLEQAFPSAASGAADYLHNFAQTSATSVGGISAVAFIVVSIFLFVAIERAFNGIWSAPNDRSWLRKLLTFYFIITFGPVLLTLSVGLSARAQLVLDRLGLETGVLVAMAPFFLTFLLFTLMHNLLPNTRVWKSASIVGGLFTAIAFETAKWGFNLYVNEVVFESYRTIYGALGLFPVFLLWVYVSWIVVLLGAELAYSVQHLRMLVDVDAAARRRPAKQKTNIFNPLVGLEVLAPIAKHFKSGEGATPETELVRQLGYNETFLREVIGDLEEMGAVARLDDSDGGERKYLPAKQLDDIPLFPVVDRLFDYAESNSPVMDELQRAYRESTREILRGQTAIGLLGLSYARGRRDAEAWAPPAENPSSTARLGGAASSSERVVGETSAREEARDPGLGREPSVQIDEDVLNEASQGELSEISETPDPLGETLDAAPREDASVLESPPEIDVAEPADTIIARDKTLPDFVAGDDFDGVIEVEDVLVIESSEVEDLEIPMQDEVAVDIDLGEDWEDFDVSDAYDDALAALDQELKETVEMQLEESEIKALSTERAQSLAASESDL